MARKKGELTSPGLKIEGERYNFKTIIVDEHDKNWGHTILKAM
jgi:hypothetical protein